MQQMQQIGVIRVKKYISLNEYRSLNGWKLKRRLDPLKKYYATKVAHARMPSVTRFKIYVWHNTRLDLDNVVGSVKPFVDALRYARVVIDDNKKHWTGLHIEHDSEMPKGTIRFVVFGEPINESNQVT